MYWEQTTSCVHCGAEVKLGTGQSRSLDGTQLNAGRFGAIIWYVVPSAALEAGGGGA